jgi:hypothetical protein
MIGGLLSRSFFGATVFSIAIGSAQLASAAVISGAMYEPFAYAAGTQFTAPPANGNNGGVGWNTTGSFALPNPVTSQWGDPSAGNASGITAGSAANKTASSPTLSHAGTLGYPLTGQGNRFRLDAANGTPTNQTQNMGRALGGQTIDAGTTYFSVLMSKEVDTIRTMNLAFMGGSATERMAVGMIGANAGNSNGNIALLMNNSNPGGLVQSATPIAMPNTAIAGTQAALIIGKIVWNAAGFEDVSIWVNPLDATSEAAAGAAYASTSAFELTSINAIRPFAGNNANAPLNAITANFDEFRIGGSWASVTTDPLPIIPEPCSLALACLAGVLLARRCRK